MPVTGTMLLVGAAAATTIYTVESQKSEAKKARSAVKKQQAEQIKAVEARELQAGEYWEEINKEQMVLQSQQNQIQLLSDIINKRNETPPPQIFTIPAAKSYTVTERINSAIADIFRR